MSNVQNVFLVGAKSLGAYGGYETFVYKLTEYHQNNPNIKYHVACKANGDGYMDETKLDNVKRISDTEFEFHNARCFKIHIPQIGAAQAIYYDVAALRECCKYIKKNNIEKPIVYIMACRIGPFAKHFYKEIKNNELYKYQNIADIAVIPTIIEEAAPLACVENMAAGLPIIITNSGGMPEYAGKKCSIIVEKDANLQYSLAKQIKDLIENKDKRKAMGRYAELEATNYSITNMYNEFYKTLKLKVEKNNEVNKDKA